MSWLNLNDSLNNIKGQITNFATNVLADGIVNDTDPLTQLSVANKRIQELENLCASQDVEIASLRRQNIEYHQQLSFNSDKTKNANRNQDENKINEVENWFWDPLSTIEDKNETRKIQDSSTTTSDLKTIISNLEMEKKDLIQSLEQLDLDCQRTTEKLITYKDELQTKYNDLKKNYDLIEKENCRLRTCVEENEHMKKILTKLQSDYKKLSSETISLDKYKLLQTDYETLQTQNQSALDKIEMLNNEIEELKVTETSRSNFSDDYKKLQDTYNELETKFKQLEYDKGEIEKKYLSTLTETVRKYNSDLIADMEEEEEVEESISKFQSKVESILKCLLDFKWKTEMLERKLCEISHEKNVAITEKNHEIEKLLQNSEILSQEVITKTQTIQHYELECSELIKNNDLLITELQQHKNNGLQTISESNEDNLLMMESQLDAANKRIRELELMIGDMENAKQDATLETQTELDYIKKQLNMTGNELSESKNECQEFKHLIKQLESEKLQSETILEKMKTELENIEYKCTELNVEVEMVREELEKSKQQNEFIEILKKEKQEMELQVNALTEKLQNSKMSETVLKLQNDTFKKEMEQQQHKYQNLLSEISKSLNDDDNNQQDLNIIEKIQLLKESSTGMNDQLRKLQTDENNSQNLTFPEKIHQLINELERKKSEEIQLKTQNNYLTEQIMNLQTEMKNLNDSKIELVNLVTTKHQENIQYHSEIQRLNHLITVEKEEKAINMKEESENEKLREQNTFLREKCEKLAQNLLEEQSRNQKLLNDSDSLTKELERLRLHLIEIEDSYTRELLQAEQENKKMLTKVNEIEQRERDSSTIYTSVNIRANQQVETLQNQLQLVTMQRDELQSKISEAEDKINKQFAALTNLQCVLEQFQKDRENDIATETERIRRQINIEKQKQSELQDEINTLRIQLEESKQGLKAAARLTEQMEKSKQQVITMKDEVTKLQDQLSKTESKYKQLSGNVESKVDKTLIRNLIVGFISHATSKGLTIDQQQILNVIGTVLDFTAEDKTKLALDKKPVTNSWYNSLLHPQSTSVASNEQSIMEAFVRFLENESQPKQAPTLPTVMPMRKMSTESNSSSHSTNTKQMPLMFNDVLPTFADFAQNRNSSSILKDVLKENQ